MLKIKDNINLKELEKFGFVYDKTFKRYNYSDEFSSTVDIMVEENRNILVWHYRGDLLFDLIKADLVEKVEGR